jgi:Holliday junction resolvasome RuvABC DNA-binding subunit
VIEERRAASLPRLTAAEARQRELENMQALKALGYTESGIVEPAAEGEVGGDDHADH